MNYIYFFIFTSKVSTAGLKQQHKDYLEVLSEKPRKSLL